MSIGVLPTAARGAVGFVFVVILAFALVAAAFGAGSPGMAGIGFLAGLVFGGPAASWGLWRDKRWGWWGVLTLLLGLAAFILGRLIDRAHAGLDAFLLVVGLLGIVATGGAAALLPHPDARDRAWD